MLPIFIIIIIIFFWGGGGGEGGGGHHKIGLYLGVISMHFRVFSEGQGTECGIFFGLLKFQIFFGVLEIPFMNVQSKHAYMGYPYETHMGSTTAFRMGYPYGLAHMRVAQMGPI